MYLALLLALAQGHAPPAISAQLQRTAVFSITGRISVYHPNDGFNRGILSCSGVIPIYFKWNQNHIAYRSWRKVGCGRRILVCTSETNKCAVSKVRDAGPYGVYRGKLRRAVAEGRWKVWVSTRAPKGWKFRAAADLSYALWSRLGKPRSLGPLKVYFIQKLRKKPRCSSTIQSLGGRRGLS